MKLINKFNDFVNLILENANSQKMPFVLSQRLYKFLQQIKHPISDELLDAYYYENETPVTLIDYDEDKLGYFKVIKSSNLFNYMSKTHYKYNKDALNNSVDLQNDLKKYFLRTKYEDMYWTQNKESMKIGKLINTIFPNKFKANGVHGKDIESFINMFKSKLVDRFKNIKIVDGDLLKKYYYEENYSNINSSSPLYNSCMRTKRCQLYVNFYAINNVKLLVLMSDKDDEQDKIIARALLWPIVKVTNPVDEEIIFNKEMTFMDRIYFTNDYDIDTLKEYANREGWLHKKFQTSSYSSDIYNPDTNEYKNLQLFTSNNFKNAIKYPYMDTMKWFNESKGYLTNRRIYDNDSNVFFLESTDGSHEIISSSHRDNVENGDDLYYSEFYDDHIDINSDIYVWCELGEDYRTYDDAETITDYNGYNVRYATEEYVENNMAYSEAERRYIDNDDVLHLSFYDDVVSRDYAQEEIYYSEIDDEYYYDNDCVYSDFHNTYIYYEDAVSVLCDINFNPKDIEDIGYYEYDNRKVNDGSYDIAIINGIDIEVDSDILEDHFVKIIYDIDNESGIESYKYGLDDGKGYFRWNGKYYANKFKDKFTGQLRLWENKIRRFNENN